MTQWMKRHKILTVVAAFLLLGACGAVVGEDPVAPDEAPAAKPAEGEEADEATSPSPAPAEEVATPDPTQEEVWAANYEASRTSYVAAVAAALALRPRNVDAEAGSLAACGLLSEERDLDKRVARLKSSFALPSTPTYDQALEALDETTALICPELATVHEEQTAERAKHLRVEARRLEARERRREEREARAAEERAQQQYVHYENCTAVENAGAAPIRAGDPGYSRDLDRDGDGVACEQ